MFCKECGEKIPDDSTICPNCGVTLVNETPVKENKDNSSFYKKLIAVVIAIVVICLVVGGVMTMLNSNNSGSDDADIKLIKISTSGYTSTLSNKKVYCYCVDGVVKNLPDNGEGYSLKGSFYDNNGSLIREVDSYLDLDYYYNDFEKSEPNLLLYMETNSLVNISSVDIFVYNPDGDIVHNESIEFKMENFRLY